MKKISLKTFLTHFRKNHKRVDKRFCFVLGAGASKPSGIPTGGELVDIWMQELKESYTDKELKDWQKKKKISLLDLPSNYPEIYDKRFELDKREGFVFLESIIEGKEPSCGYSVLAQILDKSPHKIVITTNFDSLTEDALFIYTQKKPMVIVHESLADYITPFAYRPIIVKIHRDLFFSPKNTPEQTNELEASFKKNLEAIFKHYTPLVIGYGGNDGSLMRFLEELEEIEGGMFWFYWQPGGEPNRRIQTLVEKFKGFGVPIAGFDELMIQIGNELGLELLDKTIVEIAQRRAEIYRQQIEHVNKSETQDVATKEALSGILSRGAKDWWYYELSASKEKDPNKKDTIYQEGLKQLPESPELSSSYAIFLDDIRKDHDKAEEYFKKAVELDQKNANNLGNYAIFLRKNRTDYDKSEEYFKKAIGLDPKQANNLANYAIFLKDIRKDYDRAEEYFKKAIELDPKNANILGSYALFLDDIPKDYDRAEEYFKKAIESDPKNAINLGNYAFFLKDIRKDYDRAEEYFKKAIELDPKQPINLGNYAFLLDDIRKDHDRAEEYYEKAIELDPKNANNLGNYAIFLNTIRKDYNRAKEYYEKSIELDPKQANILGNYAIFLNTIRKDYDRAEEYYKKAIELNPKNAAILVNYAIFLNTIRKDYDQAEEYYKKAIESDPKNANNLGNYANFLKDIRKDYDRAKEYYKKAIESHPNNANNLCNYAGLLLSWGKVKEGLSALQRVLPLVNAQETPNSLAAEYWFYAFAHRSAEHRDEALRNLKRVLQSGARSPNWDLVPNIVQARKDGHPDVGWLEKLAAVISEGADIGTLDAWPQWKKI